MKAVSKYGFMAAAIVASTAFFGTAAAIAAPVKNIVLVHGYFADGSGWQNVARILTHDGYNVAVVQEPETSFADDVKATTRVVDAQSGPSILVGHSYGGAVITEAGNDAKVAGLVYVAAFEPDSGESAMDLAKKMPSASTAIKATADGFLYLDPAHFHADFAADLPAAEAEFMARSQVMPAAASFGTPVSAAAWKTKPSWAVVATADRAINPDLERFMTKRAGSTTIELDSSHVAYMSHPKEVAKLIEQAAQKSPQ
ncbi:alpha/beta hydrolase [Paraburkholderia tropica]|uniref:Pimeloyl-ACP methyl ester carboxylesterase n=1 Tax=Paraburkholderia tropica TaxID=92647 RepID=A0AAQ1JWM9_9BURK|nr:alpha/beta hydrolase [Paraburkholderia tropica]RQN38196.1 alpha/beta hydrolase [Paraburkholderia tropica]SEK07822.1 Pimeloyl-ACP methyl ester carboxylesterase [Paraburkholderia tropica]